MNCKLEKFWNPIKSKNIPEHFKWTVNLKSFEISFDEIGYLKHSEMNCKLEKFWNVKFKGLNFDTFYHEL